MTITVEATDGELVGLARAGGHEAFGTLVRRHERRVVAAVAHIIGDFHESEDLAQEAFVRAFQTLDQLRDPDRFGAWTRRIAAHVALDHLRRRKTKPRTEALPPPDLAPGLPDTLTPPGGADDVARVQAAALGLPDDLRTVLALRAHQGMSYTEIATTLGIPETQVKGRLHRAREVLRERLGTWRAGGQALSRPGGGH